MRSRMFGARTLVLACDVKSIYRWSMHRFECSNAPARGALKNHPRSLSLHPQPIEVFLITTFPVHTIDLAPIVSKPSLQNLQQTFGMIPNILRTMAASPILIGSLVALFQKVHGEGRFTDPQIQTVLLTDAVTNACEWAVAFHTALALDAGLDASDVQVMRDGHVPKDKKVAALSTLARTLIEKRGRLDDKDTERFLAAGFSKELLLEVITIVAASTITNYTGSVTKPPLDAPFQKHVWSAA